MACVGQCLWSVSTGIECEGQVDEIFCEGFLWLRCSVVRCGYGGEVP